MRFWAALSADTTDTAALRWIFEVEAGDVGRPPPAAGRAVVGQLQPLVEPQPSQT